MCGCLLCAPYWGPGPQPRHVPWLGIEPATLWFAGQHWIHWATPARALWNISGLYSFNTISAAITWVWILTFYALTTITTLYVLPEVPGSRYLWSSYSLPMPIVYFLKMLVSSYHSPLPNLQRLPMAMNAILSSLGSAPYVYINLVSIVFLQESCASARPVFPTPLEYQLT